jgi:hypothetical protein
MGCIPSSATQNGAGVRLIFTALLPERIPLAFYYIVPLMSFLIDVSWYSLVALVLSSADRAASTCA